MWGGKRKTAYEVGVQKYRINPEDKWRISGKRERDRKGHREEGRDRGKLFHIKIVWIRKSGEGKIIAIVCKGSSVELLFLGEDEIGSILVWEIELVLDLYNSLVFQWAVHR